MPAERLASRAPRVHSPNPQASPIVRLSGVSQACAQTGGRARSALRDLPAHALARPAVELFRLDVSKHAWELRKWLAVPLQANTESLDCSETLRLVS
jgi:hypothetical protein